MNKEIAEGNRRILAWSDFSFQNLYTLLNKTKPINLDSACNLKLPLSESFENEDLVEKVWNRLAEPYHTGRKIWAVYDESYIYFFVSALAEMETKFEMCEFR